MISLIAAMAENRAIGLHNDLPWKLPADLKWFKQQTLGKPVIMGRNTMESINRRPLPNRRNIVISRSMQQAPEGFELASSIPQAIDRVKEVPEIMIVGGADIYRQSLSIADRLYITRVHAHIDGDAFFPEWDTAGWTCTFSEMHAADEKHAYAFTFEIWDRKA